MADRPRGPRSAALTRIEFLILAVLVRGPSHGYGIAQALTDRLAGERVRPGSLYRVLDRMMDRGLLEAVDDPEASAERRSLYGVTDEGLVVARREAALLRGFADDIQSELSSDGPRLKGA